MSPTTTAVRQPARRGRPCGRGVKRWQGEAVARVVRDALAQSLRDYGTGRAVLIDRHGTVIAGSKTVAEAQAQGVGLRVVESDGTELIAVQRRDLDLATDARAQALAVADNRVAELDLAWDEAPLRDLHAAGVDLSPFWTDAEFAALVAEPLTGRTAENAVVAPGTDRHGAGDLVALGRHRLLCGDATVADEVARVLAGVAPALMVTDPPYGVQYTPGRGVTTRIPSSGPRSARSPTTIAPTGRRRGGCFRATSRMCGTRACTPRPWRRIWKRPGSSFAPK